MPLAGPLQIFLATLVAWFGAQLVKLAVHTARTRRIELTVLWCPGGMPSSHSAAAVAMTLSVLFTEGTSALFVVSAFAAALVIYDALTLRRAVGAQGQILNKLIKERKFRPELGHKPAEVAVGIALGAIVALLFV